MAETKKRAEKARLHPRNKHHNRYDLTALVGVCPELAPFVITNNHGSETIDFFDPKGVKALNKAILMHYYGMTDWDIPAGYLCPPIPGRADYLHYIADVLQTSNFGQIPVGDKVKCLDIGVGANCVYPIIGNKEYGWSFVGSDIDPKAIKSAEAILKANPELKKHVEVRLQPKASETFLGIIQKDEKFDITICNPPFHASAEAAEAGTLRKLSNLKHEKVKKAELNFGGTSGELWTEGGEKEFIYRMIRQSAQFGQSCHWFSTLVSKQSTMKHVLQALENIKVKESKTIPMGQGNKTSRIVIWTFLTKKERKEWAQERWAEKV
jgi:23S rRNA (adenine1618-N6)-methyltransferase